MQVLREADGELRARDIKIQVERLLGGPVSRHSIKSHLHNRSGGERALFERTSRGCYRLVSDEV